MGLLRAVRMLLLSSRFLTSTQQMPGTVVGPHPSPTALPPHERSEQRGTCARARRAPGTARPTACGPVLVRGRRPEPPALLQQGRKLRPQSQPAVPARDPGRPKRPHGLSCAGHPAPRAATSWTRGPRGPRGPRRWEGRGPGAQSAAAGQRRATTQGHSSAPRLCSHPAPGDARWDPVLNWVTGLPTLSLDSHCRRDHRQGAALNRSP